MILILVNLTILPFEPTLEQDHGLEGFEKS